MGTVTFTLSNVTGCTSAALAQQLLIHAQNLPANVWVQNAVCNGTNTASVTLQTGVGGYGATAPAVTTSTVFAYMVIQ